MSIMEKNMQYKTVLTSEKINFMQPSQTSQFSFLNLAVINNVVV